jgi:hypothetical protein
MSKDGSVNVNIASQPQIYLTSMSAWRIREMMSKMTQTRLAINVFAFVRTNIVRNRLSSLQQ